MDFSTQVEDILLAEDDMDDVMMFELALKQLEADMKVQLRHAGDGDLLFIKLLEKIPDLLFLDINMPCKDGRSCIFEIRQNRNYDNMPVIMYTSYTFQEYIDDVFKNGANFYLIKPHTIKLLAEKLKMILSLDWKRQMYFPAKKDFVLN